MSRIMFFHGLESPSISDKTEYLHSKYSAVCPPMNYKDSEIFQKSLEEVKSQMPDLLIGSSMGGYIAYALSSQTGIPCLVFNPALHSRTLMEVEFPIGDKTFSSFIILGNKDELIDPEETVKYLAKNTDAKNKTVVLVDDFEHRVPIEFFEKYVKFFSSKL